MRGGLWGRGSEMARVVTQKIHIEAVSDDLSCKTIIERLESVGIFSSSLEVRPLNNIRSEFKRDPDRMTPADLERINARSSL